MSLRLANPSRRAWLSGLAAVSMVRPLRADVAPVTLGVVVPLSGSNAQFGVNIRNGLEMAVAEVNQKGGIASLDGAQVRLAYADTPAPNAAGAAVQRLASRERAVGFVGSFVSNITLAASEVTERLSIPMITHSFADQITERGYRFIFQMSPKASVLGTASFEQAFELGTIAGEPITKVAILWEDTSYGTAQSRGLRMAAAAKGVSVVLDEGYPPGITDVTPIINKLRTSGAQLVFPVSYLNDAVLIIRAMRQQGIDSPVVGGAGGYVIPDFQKALGDLASGVLSIAPANYDAAPDIARAYEQRYGIWPSHETLMYTAGFQAMVNAVNVAKSRDPQAIRDALAKTRFTDGWAKALPNGALAFDDKGLATTSQAITVQCRDGGLVTVFPRSSQVPFAWKGRMVP